MDWETAAALAVDWVRRECAEQGATGVLVLNARGSGDSIRALQRFAADHTVTTPRSHWSRVGRGVGPVLAYVPDEKALDFATGLARGSSLAVVEGYSFPLAGWARQVGAVDLARPGDAPEPIDPTVADAITRLASYKNNGFGDPFGKQQAHRILADLHAGGLLDRDLVLGALAARGASPRGVKSLAKLIDLIDVADRQ